MRFGGGASPQMANNAGGPARFVGGVFPINGVKQTMGQNGAQVGDVAIMGIVSNPASLTGWKLIDFPADPNSPGAPYTRAAWKRLVAADLTVQYGGTVDDWSPYQLIHIYRGAINDVVGRSFGRHFTVGSEVTNHSDFDVTMAGIVPAPTQLGMMFIVRASDFGARPYMTSPAVNARGEIHLRGSPVDDGVDHGFWVSGTDRLAPSDAKLPDNYPLRAHSQYCTFAEALAIELTS